MEQILVFCRPGFETEAGREITDSAAERGIFGYFEPVKDQGLVRFYPAAPETPDDLMARVALDDLVFVRDWMVVLGEFSLPEADRVGAVIEGLRGLGRGYPGCARLEVRLPENNADGDLGNFARKWVSPLSRGSVSYTHLTLPTSDLV